LPSQSAAINLDSVDHRPKMVNKSLSPTTAMCRRANDRQMTQSIIIGLRCSVSGMSVRWVF